MNNKKNILVIDSSESAAEGFKFLFENIENVGCMTYAFSYKEAIRLLKQKEFNMVLLDIYLPDRNGMGILKYIKENETAVNQIIVMSNDIISIYYKELYKELGVDYFMDRVVDFGNIGKIMTSSGMHIPGKVESSGSMN